MALGAAAPSVIPRRRDTQHIAHGTNWERLALILDEAEFHLGPSEKMRSVFFRISRSICRRYAGAHSRAADGRFRRPNPHWQAVFSQRYERGSTLVTSNLPFDEWTSVFGSERLTGAFLDRLTHHVHILEMNGDSFRLAHSKRRSRRARSEPPSDAAS